MDSGSKLRTAAEFGKLHQVRRLLTEGAPITKDSNGLTALHKAAKRGHQHVVKHLLNTGKAQPNDADKYGWTPIHWASWNGHVGVLHALLNVDPQNAQLSANLLDLTGANPIHGAAMNGHAGAVRVLTRSGCNIDQQRKDGWTPLHLSVWNGHTNVVHELLTANCQVNLRVENNAGALHLAAAKGHDDIVQELLDAGIAPDMQTKSGNTALHEAVAHHHKSTVQVLMNSDCRLNLRNDHGESPMDMARRRDFRDVMNLLSGLDDCNLQPDTQCNCAELRRILFQTQESDMQLKTDDLKKLKWTGKDGERIANHIEEKIRRTSEVRVLEIEKSWQEKVAMARAEVLAHCESRIMEVEQQYQAKLEAIQHQCSRRLEAVRDALNDRHIVPHTL